MVKEPWVIAIAASAGGFRTVTTVLGKLVAVVLTGAGADATEGVQAVKANGGIVIAQDPLSADFASMPATAIATGAVDRVLPLDAIAPALIDIVQGHSVPTVL
jgi:chemotaxis response regulator CheB